MKGNLTNDAFMNFTAEIIELGENANNQTDSIAAATKDVKRYVSEIKAANDKTTDELNKLLISALGKINFRLDCGRSKLSIIASLTRSCEHGLDNFDKLYTDAVNAQKKMVSKLYIGSNYMTKSEIKKFTKEQMLLQNKQTICIRNNKVKQDLVCSRWYFDIKKSVIVEEVIGINLADVEYFIKKCSAGQVLDIQQTNICSKKEKFFSPAKVSEYFWKLDQTLLRKAYDDCPLSQLQKNDICKKKQKSKTLEHVQENYVYYPKEIVKSAFSSCKSFADLSKWNPDRAMMCNLQRLSNLKYGKPLGERLWATFKKKYGKAQIEDLIPTCMMLPRDSTGQKPKWV